MKNRKIFSVLNNAGGGKRKKAASAISLALLCALLGTSGVCSNASAQEARSPKALDAIAKDADGKMQAYVLLVGCDVYQNKSLLPFLDYASSDVRNMRDALVKIGFPQENIRTLESYSKDMDDRPTRAAIKQALEEIFAKSGKDSVVFVAFSGHGFETAQRGSAFCPQDAAVNENDGVLDPETLILLDEVAEELRNDDAKFKVLFVDACRVHDGKKAPGAGIKGLSDATGLVVLKSCASGEYSWEDEKVKGGVFTHFFVEGLKGAANPDVNDGLSFRDICDYATKKTQTFVSENKNGRVQTPVSTFTGTTDFWVKEPVVVEPPEGGGGEKLPPGPGKVDAEVQKKYEQGRTLVWGLNGENVDVARGVALLEEAMNAGSLDAQEMLATLYFDGCDAFSADYVQTNRLASEPARRGNPYAQFVLAKCYYYGYAVQKNREEANKLSAEAFKGFVKLAEAGDTLAWNQLACCYESGFGTPRDYKKAAEYWEKAAEVGHAVSRANLSVLYASGIGVEKDEAQALKWAQEAEKQGMTFAFYHLGDFYLEGIGVEKDYYKAADYYRKSLGKNYAPAAARLGMLYENGWGVEQNVDEARKLYERAAQGHCAAGYYLLGRLYYQGVGVEQDDKEAFDCFEKAAELEDVVAMWDLANCYESGRGTSKSPKRAQEWREERLRILKEEAEAGNPFQAARLGDDYYYANVGEKPDYEEAVKWYKKASDAGVWSAIYGLGNCYYFGYGVDQDYAEAVKRFRRASELGSLDATSSLGDCYYLGKGVEQDYKEAVRLYRQAAAENHAKAMNDLGTCYELGRGVDQDYKEAFRWYKKAADLNFGWGLYYLAEYYRDGTAGEKNVPKAVEYFERAAKAGILDAWHALARIYWNGDEGVKKDALKTFRYLQEGADLGSWDAMCDLGVAYAEGLLGEKDPEKAMETWQKAAELGSGKAMYYIAQVYRDKEEYEEAAKWYQKGAEAGYADAMFALAMAYFKGEGVPQDNKKCEEYLLKAAELGHLNSIVNLGHAYSLIEELKDLKKAVFWYQKAADLGSAEGYYKLADFYLEGTGGLAKDEKKVEECLRKAFDLGSAEAMNRLGVLYGEGKLGGKKDQDKANECYKKAAAMGFEWSKLNLAQAYAASSERRAEGLRALKTLIDACEDAEVREAAKKALELYSG
ncbi:MAG: SEL1-like repeat protein, partial [Thermoguttaceae bacterium]|nr:SEL1-like repeat protein [Thermoguttaceae bacterium]